MSSSIDTFSLDKIKEQFNCFFQISQNYAGAFVFGGRFATDTFFILSGTLIAYSALKKFKKGNFN